MDFVIDLPLSANWKNNSYNPKLVIVDCLIKIVHYKPVKVPINIPRLAEVIIDVLMQHYDFSDSIINDQRTIFMLKLWLSLY